LEWAGENAASQDDPRRSSSAHPLLVDRAMATKKLPARKPVTKAAAKAATKTATKTPTKPRAVPAKSSASKKSAADALPMPEALLNATVEPDVVDVPARTVLEIEGAGAPGDAAFQAALAAVYGVTYTLKFARKFAGRPTFRVGALEGRWTAETAQTHGRPPPSTWRWQVRLGVPDDVDEAEIEATIVAATTKKGGKLEGSAAAERVHVRRLPAARFGRLLHIGPYADEPASFARLDARLAREGLAADRAHLEIYLGDPRRVAPAKLRTVLLREITA
jgi:hypothetical protein